MITTSGHKLCNSEKIDINASRSPWVPRCSAVTGKFNVYRTVFMGAPTRLACAFVLGFLLALYLLDLRLDGLGWPLVSVVVVLAVEACDWGLVLVLEMSTSLLMLPFFLKSESLADLLVWFQRFLFVLKKMGRCQ